MELVNGFFLAPRDIFMRKDIMSDAINLKIINYIFAHFQHKDTVFKGINVKKGQCLITISEMSKDINEDKKKVYNKLRSSAFKGILSRRNLGNYTLFTRDYIETEVRDIADTSETKKVIKNNNLTNEIAHSPRTERALLRQNYCTNSNKKKNTNTNNNNNTSSSNELSLLLNYWNDLASNTQIKKTSKITTKIVSNYSKSKKEFSLEEIKQSLKAISLNNFCNGDNQRGWRASFEYATRPDKIAQYLDDEITPDAQKGPKTIAEQVCAIVELHRPPDDDYDPIKALLGLTKKNQ